MHTHTLRPSSEGVVVVVVDMGGGESVVVCSKVQTTSGAAKLRAEVEKSLNARAVKVLG